jgi:hypothetical protein
MASGRPNWLVANGATEAGFEITLTVALRQ